MELDSETHTFIELHWEKLILQIIGQIGPIADTKRCLEPAQSAAIQTS